MTVKSYRHGYQHGASDIYEFVEKYSTNRLLKTQLLEFIQQRDFEMGDLTGKKAKDIEFARVVVVVFSCSRKTSETQRKKIR